MIKIIIATSNPHKLEEINAINTYPDITFDVIKGDFDPVEDGLTFAENSVIKAKEAAKIVKTYCLADDSGLCVDYLNGRPGIHSARYAPSAKERINKLLSEMENAGADERNAHFVCSMVLSDGNGNILHSEEGKVFGTIDYEPKGENGFGYDPIFFIPEFGKTMAELPEEIKNRVSHRANALTPMLKWIKNNLTD